MEKFRTIATKAMKSIDRITNAPVALVMKMLSVMGITRAIMRAAMKAIRKDRLMRASMILVSLEFGFLIIVLILMSRGFSHAKTGLEATAVALRMLLIALTAASLVLFKHSKVMRKHRHGSHIRRLARSERDAGIR